MRHFPTSIEALLRRAMKGGSPFRINPLVDFYNAVSLRRVVPVGGFDLDRVPGPLSVRLTRDGDTFSALDADGAVPVPPTLAMCVDEDVIGAPFYVMDRVIGHIVRDTLPAGYAESHDERLAIGGGEHNVCGGLEFDRRGLGRDRSGDVHDHRGCRCGATRHRQWQPGVPVR